MSERTSLLSYLSKPLAAMVAALPAAEWSTVQEVRLRRGGAPTLTSCNGMHPLAYTVSDTELQETFWRLCSRAVHTHQAELAQGFITTEQGFRVGIGGTAVVKDGLVTSYRDITSLCIRVARSITGCSTPLLPYVYENGTAHSLLLCGAPATGKTTLLRDLASQLGARCRTAVIDERMELASHALTSCDVVRGCPKAKGILQAVRTLSPDVIVVDELGGEEEWLAVAQSLFCGVAVVASAHITAPHDLAVRPAATRLLQSGGFERVAVLPPRDRWQDPATIRKAVAFLEDSGDCIDRVFLRGAGSVGGIDACAPRETLASVGAAPLPSAWRTGVFGSTDSVAFGGDAQGGFESAPVARVV